MTKLANIADDLGRIKAEIADLEIRKGELEDIIIESGETEVEGRLFRVTVSIFDRATVAWRKIAEKLGASRQIIKANTGEAKEVITVKVVARKAA